MRNRKIKYAEITLISLVWVVLLVTPVLFREDNMNPIWNSINNQLEILIPIFVLFLLNRFALVPYFLFKGKLSIYFVSIIGLIVLFSIGMNYYDTKKDQPPSFNALVDPSGKPSSKPLPDQADQREEPPVQRERQPRPVPPFANFIVLSVLLLGFDSGLRSGLRWIAVENEKLHLEKENVATQLVLLRNQISPHFFMNTLNNIHALVDKNSAEAKEAIIKLSKMMRYLLYETETDKTTLKSEVEFLESYVNLMKLRYNSKVRINFKSPQVVPEKIIPPFLFISLIENAFKHGISYREESFIDIDLIIGENRLLLIIKNSKTDQNQLHPFTGIGIENTRKRLSLLYGQDYHLDIINAEELFTVNLSIPI